MADALFPAHARVLDAGSGVGVDARWLLDGGRSVQAIDASPGMVNEARARAPEARPRVLPLERAAELLVEDPRLFDAAILNFGVINCVNLGAAAAALAAVLRPGAPLLVVTMPRVAPGFIASALVHGQLRRALGRLRPAVAVDVEGIAVTTRYRNARDIALAFAPGFALEWREGLGLLLPPPGSRVAPAMLERLAEVEATVRRWPLLRDVGDHVLVVLRRR